MVREVKRQILLPGVTAQQYYDVIYGDDEALTVYHKRHFVGDVVSEPWGDLHRFVSYSMPINAPAVVKRLIGRDVIPVTEEQSLAWEGDRRFVVKTCPRPKIPGADNFETRVTITVTSLPDGSCRVDFRVTVTCGIWAMQSVVEATMEKEATDTISKWADFCGEYVPDVLKKAAAASKPATPPTSTPSRTPAIPADHRSSESDEDHEWHDAMHFDLPDGVDESMDAPPPLDRSLSSRSPMRFEQAVIAYMQALHGTCRDGAAASAAIAAELVALRRELNQHIATTSVATSTGATHDGPTLSSEPAPPPAHMGRGSLLLVFAGGMAAGAAAVLLASGGMRGHSLTSILTRSDR